MARCAWLALVFAMLATACASDDEPDAADEAPADAGENDDASGTRPDEFGLGASIILTGAGVFGEYQARGVQLAVEQINAAGGVDGVPLNLILEDNELSAEKGVSVMRKFVDVDDVPVVITSSSAVTLATAPLAEDNSILLLNGGGAGPELRGASPWLFNINALCTDEADAMLEYTREELGDIETLATYGLNDDFGRGCSEYAAEKWTELGGSVTRQEYVSVGELNHRAQISALKADDPDAVMIFLTADEMTSFYQQARAGGLDSQILGLTTVETPSLLEDVPEESAGTFYAAAGLPSECATDRCTKLIDGWRDEYGEAVPHVQSMNYYDLVYVLADLIEYTLENDLPYNGDSLREALLEIRTFETASGEVTFRDDGTVGKPITVKRIEAGEFVRVADYTPSE